MYGWKSDNMLKSNTYRPWFMGWEIIGKDSNANGTTQLEALQFFLLPVGPTDMPLCLPL